MYNGKRARSGSQKHFKRSLTLIASLVLMLSIGLGTTIAWLVDDTEDVKNVFTPGRVPPTIVEKFNGEVKEYVKVTNGGNVSAFIRVAVIATWKDGQGNIAPTAPIKGTHFDWETGSSKWFQKNPSDGYYYYTDAVAAGATTENLFTNCQLMEGVTPPEGYSLSIEILAQTIQADGVDSEGKHPVAEQWKVTYTAGNPATIG